MIYSFYCYNKHKKLSTGWYGHKNSWPFFFCSYLPLTILPLNRLTPHRFLLIFNTLIHYRISFDVATVINMEYENGFRCFQDIRPSYRNSFGVFTQIQYIYIPTFRTANSIVIWLNGNCERCTTITIFVHSLEP